MSFKKFLPLLVIAAVVVILYLPGCDELITESYTVEVYDSTLGSECARCHTDNDNRYLRPTGQWENSAHASSRLLEGDVDLNGSPEQVAQCGARCHTHEGFVKFVDDSTTNDQSTPSVIGCFTCHSPHTGAFGSWSDTILRGLEDFTILTGNSVYQHGKSNMCAMCHQATNAAPLSSSDQTIDNDWGPHFSPQADAFMGVSGYQLGDPEIQANPHLNVTDGCLGCHYGSGQGYEFGEHSFRLRSDAGEGYLRNCNRAGCHVGTRELDSLKHYTSYDSLLIYGDSLEVLLKTWGLLDPDDATGKRFVVPDSAIDGEQAQVLYNYLFYRLDGSHGVHNPPYINELLRTSLETFSTTPPKAIFDISDTVICYGDSVFFYDRSSSMVGITDWCWSFGDDLDTCSDDTHNPVHVYSEPGTYWVTLYIVDGNNADFWTLDLPIVVQGPQAVISIDEVAGVATDGIIDTAEGFAPLDVMFSDASECLSGAATWTWAFGDGDTVTLQDPGLHTFDTIGDFQVTLTIGDADDSLIENISTKYIRARGPEAAFEADWSFGFSPHTVQFTDLSQAGGAITSHLWNFGDPSTEDDTSSLQNPTYTFTTPGKYDVSLTVGTDLGSDTHIESDFITIFQPAAIFSWDVDSGCAPLTVTFGNESIDIDNVDTVIWFFGDGDSLVQTVPSAFGDPVIHEYNAADTFDVRLYVAGGWGNNSDTRYNLIQSLGPDPRFEYNDSLDYCAGDEVTFTSLDPCDSPTLPTTHLWNFSDGETSSEANPVHTFMSDGGFRIYHTTSNVYDTLVDSSTTVTVTGPSAQSTADISDGCRGLAVTFTNHSSCPIDEWHWYFNDGTDEIVTDTNVVTHTYTSPAYFVPSLAVSFGGVTLDSVACSDTIHVVAVEAAFATSETPACSGEEVTFTDVSLCGAAAWSWDFGDGGTSDEQNPTHAYEASSSLTADTFVVSLTVWDADGNQSPNVARESIVVVGGPPKAMFRIESRIGYRVEMEDQSILAYEWSWVVLDPSGGIYTESHNQSPVFQLQGDSGTYIVPLTVTNRCGEDTSEPLEIIVE